MGIGIFLRAANGILPAFTFDPPEISGLTPFDSGIAVVLANGDAAIDVVFETPLDDPPVFVPIVPDVGQSVSVDEGLITETGFTILLSGPATAGVKVGWAAYNVALPEGDQEGVAEVAVNDDEEIVVPFSPVRTSAPGLVLLTPYGPQACWVHQPSVLATGFTIKLAGPTPAGIRVGWAAR